MTSTTYRPAPAAEARPRAPALAGLLSLLALTLTLGGCAFGARQATLQYPPRADPGAVATANAAAAPASKAEIALQTFSDQRAQKGQVGSVRNGFGMPTAQVVTSDSVPQWVTDALRSELTRAGYRVVGATSPASTELSGDIANVWCDAYFTYSGEVTLNVRLQRDGKELLTKTYEGRGSAGMNWAATAEAYSQTLSVTLADALRQLVADIDRTLPTP